MIWRIVILLAFGVLSACVQTKPEQVLFTYDGVDYTRDELPQRFQLELYNKQSEMYKDSLLIVKNAVIEIHLEKKAKDTGRSYDEVRAEYFKTLNPTDEEKKAYYETVKEQLPYSYALVKHELAEMMQEDANTKAEQTIIEEIRAEKGVMVNLVVPKSPVADVKVAGYPTMGDENAKVRLVEFGDFTCPHCKEAVAEVKGLMKKFEGKLQVTWRYFFLHDTGSSVRLARGAHCAQQQGKFWEYHDYVFENQSNVRWKKPEKFIQELKGFDEEAFKTCYEDEASEAFVKNSHEDAKKLGVNKTPTFFLDGKKVVLGAGFKDLEQTIKDAVWKANYDYVH